MYVVIWEPDAITGYLGSGIRIEKDFFLLSNNHPASLSIDYNHSQNIWEKL